MTYSITQFENNAQNSLQALDNNFITFGALVPIPCSIAGTNALTLTPNAAGLVPTPTISAYTTNMLFSGIAAGTNGGATTATVGSIGVLPVYKDGPAGPVALTGNEIIANNAISLRYDAALNSGNGGFHLIASTSQNGLPASVAALSATSVQVNGNSTITNLLSGNSPTLTFTATPGWSGQNQTFTLTGLPPNIPAAGDFVQINPPSLNAVGVQFTGYVQAVGSLSSVASVATVAIQLQNAGSASLASNSGIYRYLIGRAVP